MSHPDNLTIAMQDDAIRIAEMRLNRPLPTNLKEKIRLNRWSYMGLEMIIDTVRTIELNDLEQYLANLDK
jgi:hypothetical protein